VYRAGVLTRKIDIGGVVSKVFDLYFRYAAVLLPVAAALFLIEAAFRLLGLASTPLALVAGVVGLILSTVYTGIVVRLVDDVRDGRLDQSPGDLARSVCCC
jgi:ABC-type transport system involved in cytochrome bd biosynthesis fused ATPase/permease subunit